MDQAAVPLTMLLALAFSVGTQAVFIVFCAGIGAWRFSRLQATTREAKEREALDPCRHCGERVDPKSVVCPVCGEDAPFG